MRKSISKGIANNAHDPQLGHMRRGGKGELGDQETKGQMSGEKKRTGIAKMGKSQWGKGNPS